MQIEIIDNPLVLPRRPARTITLALHDHQGSDSVSDATMPAEAQARLLMSWRAVLGEIGSSELGAGRW